MHLSRPSGYPVVLLCSGCVFCSPSRTHDETTLVEPDYFREVSEAHLPFENRVRGNFSPNMPQILLDVLANPEPAGSVSFPMVRSRHTGR
jgi:hypothetical protein